MANAGVLRNDIRGKIYFIQSGDRPFVKIGWAIDVQSRLMQLQCGNPDTLKLLGSVPGTTDDERGWRAMFRHLIIRSEWLELTDELRAAIKDRRNVARSILIERIGPAMNRDEAVAWILANRQAEGRPRKTTFKSNLDDKKVAAILVDTRSIRAIAKDYGVATMTVHAIRARKTWRHVQIPLPAQEPLT